MKKLIGFQVISATLDIHPLMDGSFCVYSLAQCEEMLSKGFNGTWIICPVMEGWIEEPTIMYDGELDIVVGYVEKERVEQKKKEIEEMLFEIYSNIGIDRPENHDQILEFLFDDVNETADPNDWHSGDVDIAFRRFLESKSKDSEY